MYLMQCGRWHVYRGILLILVRIYHRLTWTSKATLPVKILFDGNL